MTNQADALAVHGLSVVVDSYKALDDVTFRLPQGAFFCIIGPNGAGKSMLLKTILGLVEPVSGTIEVLGKAHRQRDVMQVGYVPQIKTLSLDFPATVIDLVVNGMRASWPARIQAEERQKALAALATVGAEHLATRKLRGLSGGQLQRIFLARGLARSPKLLILDEPATGIDSTGEEDMHSLLEQERLRRGTTIVMVSHDLHTAMHHASHVLVLNRRQLAFGPPAQALTEASLGRAFGHIRHSHDMALGHRSHQHP